MGGLLARAVPPLAILSVAFCPAALCAPLARADHVFVATSDGTTGNCAALEILSPWSAATNLEPVGAFATMRHFAGLHWVVNGAPWTGNGKGSDDVQAVDPFTFETVRRFPVGAGTNPRDIAFADATHAWVSRFDSRWLLEIDATTGAALDSVDLGGFSDADGLPEMAWMALDGTHLFVQIQRIDRNGSGTTVRPALLAVVDVAARELIDVDPTTSGIQGIELLGPEPQTKMQIEGRRLYVATPGGFLDVSGGIEEIDLDTFANLGFLVSESEWSIDMGAFVLVSPTRGYVVNHTDFTLSSHLQSFERPSGTFLAEHFVSFSMIESVVHDALTDQVFFPDPQAGVRIFRGATGEMLGGPVSTGLAPDDLVVFRGGSTTAGVSLPAGLTLSVAPNPSRSAVRITWSGPTTAPVDVTIYDVVGRIVREVEEDRESARIQLGLEWDGRDELGRTVGSGVYTVRATSGNLVASRSIVRLR